MNKKRIIVSAVLTFAILLAMLVGCVAEKAPPAEESSQQNQSSSTEEETSKEVTDTKESDTPEYLNETGFPIVKEPITLKIMAGVTPMLGNFDEMIVWQEYEKMTGIHIEWDQVPMANLAEKRNIVLATGEYPDAFIKCGMPTSDLMKYGQQGIFIKLNEQINQYAPNFMKILEEFPDAKKGLTMVDGSIYSFPYIVSPLSPRMGMKVFINRNWLDKVGKEMPETTDEFYEILKAFKENDLNGNGEVDEIPLTSQNMNLCINGLKGAWGLGNRGSGSAHIDINENNGELRFIPADSNYKELLQYLNRLYAEKLIDQEIFTNDWPQVAAKGAENSIGSLIGINHTFVGPEHEEEFEGIPAALRGPHGEQIFAGVGSELSVKGAFVITDRNKYPEATIRWIDYFYGEEGIKLYFMGIEGDTYIVTPEGKYEYADKIKNNKEGLTHDQARGQYVPWLGGGNPSVVLEQFFSGAAMLPISLEASKKLEPYIPKEIWSEFNFNPEENDKMIALGNDILNYVTEMQAKFIGGDVSFNEWDNYIKTLEKMGLDEYMEIYKAAYQRYQNSN